MAFRLIAVVAAMACINMAAGHFHKEEPVCPTQVIEVEVPVPVPVPVCAPPAPVCPAPAPVCAAPAPVCPAPALPCYEPIVVQSVIPAAVNIGPQAPGVIEHHSHPYEINYFEKPWIVKHAQSAALNVFTQHPVVVDEYAHPTFHEQEAPAAVVVEEVCGVPAPVCAAPVPVCAAPAPCH